MLGMVRGIVSSEVRRFAPRCVAKLLVLFTRTTSIRTVVDQTSTLVQYPMTRWSRKARSEAMEFGLRTFENRCMYD